jgi:GMP synthase (glutamine-hydrolysing)
MCVGANAIGLQFHPEVTNAMICRWTTKNVDRLASPGAQPAHLHHEGWRLHDNALARWSRAFLERWQAGAWAAA